jgi:predicted DNA-binding protein (MmcQ/YjbR family)
MNIEDIQAICRKLQGVTEDIKWEHDLAFSIGRKMFFVIELDQSPTSASFKVKDEEFDEISNLPGFRPAPYAAKNKWVLIEDISKLERADWEKYIRQSYALVKDKLSGKLKKQIDG